MSKFFIKPEDVLGDTVSITGSDAVHLARVLRKRVGDELVLSDGKGTEYQAVIFSISEQAIALKILMQQQGTGESSVQITLYQGLPKSDKMESILMRCTELGACRFVPMWTRFTVPKPSDGMSRKLERWQKVAAESAKQCMRSRIPSVNAPLSFAQAVREANGYDLALIPYELESDCRLRPLLETSFLKNGHSPKSIAIFIGPEGGFSREEVELAKAEHIRPVTLGPRILRTETAGCAVISMLLYALDEI